MRRWQAELMFQGFAASKAGIPTACDPAGAEQTWNASSTTTGLYVSSEGLGVADYDS